MHRLLRWFSLGLCVIGFLLISTLIYAQDGEEGDPEYVGSQECTSCHRNLRDHNQSRHALALQNIGGEDVVVLGNFDQDEDIRTLTFPDKDEARPVAMDDIAFAIGSGRYVQRYLYEVSSDEYQVLPVEWNVAEEQWQPFALDEEWPSPAYDWISNCAGCHTTGLDVTENTWIDDGVQCEACHGPGSIHLDFADVLARNATDEEIAEARSKIVLSDDAQICGQCHIRGVEPENGHPFPTNYVPDMNLLDEGVFSPVSPDDEAHWWLSGHAKQPNMQFNEWIESSHAGSLTTLQNSDISEDSCLQCHGGEYRRRAVLLDLYEADDIDGISPGPLTTENAQYGITCTTCHNPHSEEYEDHLVQEPYELCVQCHSNSNPTEGGIHHPVREMFEGIEMISGVEGIPSTHFTDEAGPDCLTCHMPDVPVGSTTRASHALSPILPSVDGELPSACLECHSDLSDQDTDLTNLDWEFLVADTQENVRTRLSVAWARVASLDVPELGTDARLQYDQAIAALTFVQNDGSLGVHNYAYADTLLSSVEHAMSELNARGSSPQPTEAPAPTAIPAEPITSSSVVFEEKSDSGARPMTWLIIALVVVSLTGAAYAFFRNSTDMEA